MNAVTEKMPTTIAGYKTFELGAFTFARDEYFVTITWPVQGGRRQSHTISADAFLRALMRDVAWGFFYGVVNFDPVFGTRNLYGKVEFFAGRLNEHYHKNGLSYVEVFDTPVAMKLIKEILADWVNSGFDPFAAPMETGDAAFGEKHGDNMKAIDRYRVPTKRMPGMEGDSPLRGDDNGYPINRAFADVAQDKPEIKAESGFEKEMQAFNLFAYLSRSDVTWNGNDRVEWFLQLSDEIMWNISDKDTGRPRARVLMKAGDVAAMPADIAHQGFSKKRSMLLVWENANPEIVKMYETGKVPPYPVEF